MAKSFSSILKEEIIKYKWSDNEMNYFINSLLLFSKNNIIKFKNPTLGKILYIYLKSINIEIKVIQLKNHYETIIPKKFQSIDILNEDNIKYHSPIIAGLFISRGSTNSPKSKFYHLDIRVDTIQQADNIIHILNRYNLDAKKYIGKNRILVYLKKSSNISDFFKLVNSHEAVMYFEDIRINRDFSNSLLRLNTIDVVNAKKAVEASQKQIKKINKLIDIDILKQYHIRYIKIAKLRLEYSESNLEELTDIYNKKFGTNYTKSAINHWLRFILNLKDKYE